MSTQLQRHCALIAALLLGMAALLALADGEPAAGPTAPPLVALLPASFGGWTELPDAQAQVSSTLAQRAAAGLPPVYDQELSRSYRNTQGRQVMLMIAYARAQSPSKTIHEPQRCYPAEGFDILEFAPARLLLPQALAGHRMLAQRGSRLEAVAYWTRIGSLHSPGPLTLRLHLAREQLQGRMPDGVLVRASTLLRRAAETAEAQTMLDAFFRELLAASPPALHALLQAPDA